MTWRTALLLAIVVLAGTGGEIAMSHAIRKVGEPPSLAPQRLLRLLAKAFQQGWIWVSIGLMALAFFALLALLSWAEVSYVIPLTASGYIFGALGAKFLLGERISTMRWIGVMLVGVGVALVSAG